MDGKPVYSFTAEILKHLYFTYHFVGNFSQWFLAIPYMETNFPAMSYYLKNTGKRGGLNFFRVGISLWKTVPKDKIYFHLENHVRQKKFYHFYGNSLKSKICSTCYPSTWKICPTTHVWLKKIGTSNALVYARNKRCKYSNKIFSYIFIAELQTKIHYTMCLRKKFRQKF